ncbi:hypothetical protein KC359_g10 [Hortaea werneckii]|nr:hypothetical protein KC359_g10 [Hortaea werneckii]
MECAGFVVVRGWEGIGVVGLVRKRETQRDSGHGRAGVSCRLDGLNLTTCSAHNDLTSKPWDKPHLSSLLFPEELVHSRYRSTSKRDTVTLSSSLLLLSCGNLFAFFSPPSQCMLLNDTVAFEQERCSVVSYLLPCDGRSLARSSKNAAYGH